MAGAILGAIPVLLETLEGARSKAAENSEFYINQFISLAIVACFVAGQYATAGIVAIILMVGHVLRTAACSASTRPSTACSSLPCKARRLLPNGQEEEVDPIRCGKGTPSACARAIRFRRRAGDPRSSTINQANITGESLPVEAPVDAQVFAGTTNLTGVLEVFVTQAGGNTVLGRVKKIVEEAQSTRAPIVALTEQYAQYYLPLILLIAGFVLFFTHDILRSISVIIAAIPCHLHPRRPHRHGRGAGHGVAHRRHGEERAVLEAAAEIDTVVFDKTGTLTTGRLQVMQMDAVQGEESRRILTLAAALEATSTHPIGLAIVRAAHQAGLAVPEAADISEDHGLGMMGHIDGRLVRVGRASWLAARALPSGRCRNR
ncbi:MAG: HAD-IC family P-type ATPase [Verrucomicrobiota bacterium]